MLCTGVAFSSASGVKSRNFSICKRDRASAAGLNAPNICLNDMQKPFFAANKYRGLIRDIRGIDGDEPVSQTCVIGLLSVINTILFPFHCAPHVSVAAVIAYNSLKSMDGRREDVSHAPQIHFEL